MELIRQLVEQLGITSDQAKGGLGALLSVAREKLGDEKYSQLTTAVPGLSGMETSAPQGGTLSAVGALAGSLGGSLGKLGSMGQLADKFAAIDLGNDMLGRFLPLVLTFVEQKGGSAAKQLLAGVMK